MRRTATKLVNWRQILEQLDAAGVNVSEVARRLDMNRSTLQYWLNGGGEPRYSDGVALLKLRDSVIAHHDLQEIKSSV